MSPLSGPGGIARPVDSPAPFGNLLGSLLRLGGQRLFAYDEAGALVLSMPDDPEGRDLGARAMDLLREVANRGEALVRGGDERLYRLSGLEGLDGAADALGLPRGGRIIAASPVEPGEKAEDRAFLEAQAKQLKGALETLEKRNSQILKEMNLASELQKSLLPKEFPRDLPVEFAHKYIPLSTIGGDFFDVVRVDERHVGVIITDVSGHGVAPAFITAMFKSAFNHFAPRETSPAKVIARLNLEFSRMIRTEHYLTAFYAIIDTESLACRICNAGHPNQLLVKADGKAYELGTQGFFIGMFERTAYQDRAIRLGPGDTLCFFTDGIVETHDAAGAQFGRQGILRSMRNSRALSLEATTNALVSDLIQFMKGPSLEDDITFLCAKIVESI